MRHLKYTTWAIVLTAFTLIPAIKAVAQDAHHHQELSEAIVVENSHGISEHDHATDHGSSAQKFSMVTFAGKFHPLVVHFPIALLLAATLSEIFCMVKSRKEISDITLFCIVLGAIGAMIAAPLGWANAAGTHYDATIASMSVVTLHRWTGVITTLLAIAATALAFRAKRSQKLSALRLFRCALIASTMLVSITGHLGATLVFGVDYFSL